MEKGDLEKGRSTLSPRSLRLSRDFGDAHFNLGVVRTSQGSVKKAVASFRQALKLNSDNTEAQQRLALLLEKANP